MEPLTRIDVDPRTAVVYASGWQSWSPTAARGVRDDPARPVDDHARVMSFRGDGWQPGPGGPAADDGHRGEGLLALQPAVDAPVHVFAARSPSAVPTIVARLDGDAVVVAADADVDHSAHDGPGGLESALARWADGFARSWAPAGIRRAPTTWCSWYHYFTDVTQSDVLENLAALTQNELPVDVVQLDDGYQSEIGDWLTLSERFDSVELMLALVRDAGFGAGIWTAPFLVGARSSTAAGHPEWLVGGPDGPVVAGRNWGQDLFVLDVTHPGAADWLERVYRTMAAWGVGFHKIDFVYAGALPGRRYEDVAPLDAYRRGIELIRGAVGDAYLLGCGAPLLPSVGLVDAMRVSPDTAPADVRRAMRTGRARAFLHGRFWVNDPDCLIVRPAVPERREWAAHVQRWGGLRSSSDRIADLDAWGLETTREILASAPPDVLVGA